MDREILLIGRTKIFVIMRVLQVRGAHHATTTIIIIIIVVVVVVIIVIRACEQVVGNYCVPATAGLLTAAGGVCGGGRKAAGRGKEGGRRGEGGRKGGGTEVHSPLFALY